MKKNNLINNKGGFTLVELLAVITILAIITTIAASNAISLTLKSKENLYCTKLNMIKNLARDYGINLEKELNNSDIYFEGSKSVKITVEDLIKAGKLSPDKEELVLSPIDNTSLNDMEIILYLKNNQINAYVDSNNVC